MKRRQVSFATRAVRRRLLKRRTWLAATDAQALEKVDGRHGGGREGRRYAVRRAVQAEGGSRRTLAGSCALCASAFVIVVVGGWPLQRIRNCRSEAPRPALALKPHRLTAKRSHSKRARASEDSAARQLATSHSSRVGQSLRILCSTNRRPAGDW